MMMALKGSFTHTGKQESQALFSTAAPEDRLSLLLLIFFLSRFSFLAVVVVAELSQKALQGFPKIRPWRLAETYSKVNVTLVDTWTFWHLELESHFSCWLIDIGDDMYVQGSWTWSMCNCNANLRVSLQGSFLVASTQCCSCIKDHKSNLGMTRHKAAAAASMSSSLSSAAYIYMTSTDLQLWPLFFFVMSSARPTLYIYIYTKAFSILSLLHMYDTLALFYWSRFPEGRY